MSCWVSFVGVKKSSFLWHTAFVSLVNQNFFAFGLRSGIYDLAISVISSLNIVHR